MSHYIHNFWIRNFTIALIVVMFSTTLAPFASIGYAEETTIPPAEEVTPTPVVEEPSSTTETPSDSGHTNDTPGEDGQDGEPQPETPPQDGEQGDDATHHEDATDGENGENAETPTNPEPAPDGEESVIVTGDADSNAQGVNEGNNTAIDAPATGGGGTDNASTTVSLDNDLDSDNAASSTAETGDNHVADPDGAIAVTGDADAFGYLISLFNVAVTNSSGSILFLRNPLASSLDFTQRIMAVFENMTGGSGECSFLGCAINDAVFNFLGNNTAEVTNDLIVRSGTGNNTATSSNGLAGIDTGDANAFGGIVNFGNLQIIDSRYLVILMNNVGNLAGDIILPEPDFFKRLSAGAAIGRGSSLNVNNTVDIENNGATNAGSGDNSAEGVENADIDTGEAHANTSVLNFANQIGAPICFIVTVGGEWRGDVVRLPEGFSREETNFGEIICGTGGGASRQTGPTNLHASTTNYARILNNAIVEATTGNNSVVGLDARIRTGDADAFLQILNVVNQTIIGQDWIFALFTISGDWDGDLVFGTSPTETSVAHILASRMIAGGGAPGGYTSNPNIKVTKTASVNRAAAPSKIDYKIVVKNEAGGGALYRATLSDTLLDPSGEKVYTRMWNLGTVQDGEEVTLTYTVEYNKNIPYGEYKNTAKVTGYRNSSIYVFPQPFTPATDTETVTIDSAAPVVTKAAGSDLRCEPLLKSYIKIGKTNAPTDVKSLQSFLKNYEGETELDENGIYDVTTIAAVKRFQYKYASEILTPWGIQEATGQVYYTTQRKINDLACVGNEDFPLNITQLKEIEGFRTRVETTPGAVDPVSEGVGKADSVERTEAFTTAPLEEGVKVLLKDLAPSSTSKSFSDAKNLKSFSWFSYFFPLVDAFEL